MLLAVLGVAAPASAERQDVTPLPQAHAHNDYEHDRPLFDALDRGFTSVEADIHLVDGALLVAHDRPDTTPERNLQALYLDPLRDLVKDNGGSVFPDYDGEFQLLVDIKADGAAAYEVLDKIVRDPAYDGVFTHYANGEVQRGPVTIVLSGDRPRDVMEGQDDRFAFYDGRINGGDDLGIGADAKLVPLVSKSWTDEFSWVGIGRMPEDQRAKLHKIVDDAHAADQRVRFWATPDARLPNREAVWRELVDAGVDHINTDDLDGLAKFLRR
ncbi:phosphatidylinositol-specific phospholipase C/glycerophosphodiester phosphodiesterase family protein [Saccharopolyspora taberi]